MAQPDAHKTPDDTPPTMPLQGVVIADFSRVLAGPLATMTLADLGATVIKVERPQHGDDTRHWGPPWTANSTTYFESVNRSKLSVTLDLQDAEDRALAHELVTRADVLVENFRPGTLDGFGLSPTAAAELNPRLVYCSISGFGRNAGAAMPGYDFVVQALGGLMDITGGRDGEPTKAGVALVDVLTGKDAVAAILAALWARQSTGLGQHVTVDLLSSLLAAFVNQGASYLATGIAPHRMGNQHPSIAPYETLRCRDGLVAIACGNDTQFGRLATSLGIPQVAEHPSFATNSARVTHRTELISILEDALAAFTADQCEESLRRAGVPVGRVGTIADGFALAHRLGLEPTTVIGDEFAPQTRHPAQYSRSALRDPQAPPNLGEHNLAVREWLRGRGAEIDVPPPA